MMDTEGIAPFTVGISVNRIEWESELESDF